jgi:hypothetical protein
MAERFKPITYVRQEDFAELEESVGELQDLVTVLMHAFSGLVGDLNALADYVDSIEVTGGEEETGGEEIGDAMEDSWPEESPEEEAARLLLNEIEETPEEEAARLRAEAIAEFEAGNEATVPAPDPNDVQGIPDDGIPVGPVNPKDEGARQREIEWRLETESKGV